MMKGFISILLIMIHFFPEKCECVEVTLGSPKLFCAAEYDYGKCCLTEGIDSVFCEPIMTVKEGDTIQQHSGVNPSDLSVKHF